MTTSRRILILAAPFASLLLFSASARAEPCCGPITPAGALLLARLNASGVDRRWTPGQHVIWDTGEPDPFAGPRAGDAPISHCGSFVAAFAKSMNIYILRPPDHIQRKLENGQMVWLAADGAAQGWRSLPNATSAQRSANQGNLVVVVFEHPDIVRSGHIAIVRPGTPDAATLAAQGPDVTQAGSTNAISTPLAQGFRHHSGAWPNGVRFFEHTIGT